MAEGPEELEQLLQRGYRYALGLTHERARAEDLLQEACLRISKRGGPWRLAYLCTVVRNVYIDEYRRGQKIRFNPLAEDADPPAFTRPEDGFGDERSPAIGTLARQTGEIRGFPGKTAPGYGNRPRHNP